MKKTLQSQQRKTGICTCYFNIVIAWILFPCYSSGLFAVVDPNATNPFPTETFSDYNYNISLSWNPGQNAGWHDVYFSTNMEKVANGVPGKADLDFNGNFDFDDIAVFSSQWLFQPDQLKYDYHPDNIIDLNDYSIFADYWATQNSLIDLDNNGILNVNDLKVFLDQWLSFKSPVVSDLNDDDIVDIQDFSVFSSSWNDQEASAYMGRIDVNDFDPGPLQPGQTYYWRIDEVHSYLPNAVSKGQIWQFSTPSGINLGTRRELFVDDYLIRELNGATLKVNPPVSGGVALYLNELPWESQAANYITVLNDDGLYQMYYRGDRAYCYAESNDGINWTKPNLAIYEINGTFNNNVIMIEDPAFTGKWLYTANFSPFIDKNPSSPLAERYKAVAGMDLNGFGLYAFDSSDGIHWALMQPEPIIVSSDYIVPSTWAGWFDSQNSAFWSESENCYVCYIRVWVNNIRKVAKLTSDDFINWSSPVLIEDEEIPHSSIYVNQTVPYYRSPHIYLATSGRKVVRWTESINDWGYYSGEGVLMSTRGTEKYELHDDLQSNSYFPMGTDYQFRSNFPAKGIVSTGPYEMSMYINRMYDNPANHVERMIHRPDGFISVNAGTEGGEMLTKPLSFEGNQLEINYEALVGGSVRIEIQDVYGEALSGYSLSECDALVSDEIEGIVHWTGSSDISQLTGTPVQLRFVLEDADIYSIRFKESQ